MNKIGDRVWNRLFLRARGLPHDKKIVVFWELAGLDLGGVLESFTPQDKQDILQDGSLCFRCVRYENCSAHGKTKSKTESETDSETDSETESQTEGETECETEEQLPMDIT
jgi:hypothetical protein